MLRPLLFSLIAVVGLSAAAPDADAYFPGTFGPRVGYSGFGITNYGGPGFGWGGYGGLGGYGYGYGNVPTPPYFALHPPVYYSYPVARPYGISPFPIGSYTPSHRVVYTTPTPEPQVVINPYVTTEAPEAEEALPPSADLGDAADATTIQAEDAETDAAAVEEPAVEEPAQAEPTKAAPGDANEAAASYWPTPQVVINPFVNSNLVVPVSFTKIVTP